MQAAVSAGHTVTVLHPGPTDTALPFNRRKSHQYLALPSRLGRHERCSFPPRKVYSSSLKELPVSSVPFAQSEPLGIVIRSGAPKPKPVRFWAYLWAADDEDTVEQHWHQRVPAEHAA
jgi:hypothetical protein